MTTTENATQQKVNMFHSTLSQERVNALIEHSRQKFLLLIKASQRFHTVFFSLVGCELVSLCTLALFSKSLFIAFALAGLCLTVFSYLLIRFYQETKHREEARAVLQEFLGACKDEIPEASPLSCARALHHLLHVINFKDLELHANHPFLQKCLVWLHWKEVHEMQKRLLHHALEYHIQAIKEEPQDIQAHASLAQAYLSLGHVYCPPEDFLWVPKAFLGKPMQDNAKRCFEFALQEWKIISAFSPNDPWIHLQLAQVFYLLERSDEELKELELVHRLQPHDRDAMLHLGIKYFEQNMPAQALALYQALKKANDARAEELISHYTRLI